MKLKDRNIENVTHIAVTLSKREKQSFYVIPCPMGCDIVVKSNSYKKYLREIQYTDEAIIIKDNNGKKLYKSDIEKSKTEAKQKKVQGKRQLPEATGKEVL